MKEEKEREKKKRDESAVAIRASAPLSCTFS